MNSRQRTSDTLLRCATPAGWAAQAVDGLDQTLIDHAHCEKKAAASAISLINAYHNDDALVSALIPLAIEEMEHFQEVHQMLQARGVPLTRDEGDPYVGELLKLVRKSGPGRKVDRLLVAALIESRSCERFRLLKEELTARSDTEMAAVFRRFESSEAGHAVLFIGLAKRCESPEAVEVRLEELAEAEAAVVRNLPILPRIH